TAADGRSWLGEARAALALDRAAQAEQALRRATALAPADPEPWRLWLELLRVEDRTLDAQRIGWSAYAAVPPSARREVLRALTLALLADVPEEHARMRLARWAEADPDDLDARVALLRRIAAAPRGGDPEAADRIAILTTLLRCDPSHSGAREALVSELAAAGEIDRGRAVLDAWPEATRDARYDRLRGRWDLDYDHHPDRAVVTFRRALAALPHDGRTHAALARALQALDRPDEARHAAEEVARLRETLDPAALGRRLEADFTHLEDPRSRLDLADLCARAGLARLAAAWRRDAEEPPRVGTASHR
ncbi:MAG: hypothetical protein IRY99_18725, partial [Isosphaeraceae bacterium]|nr:hypothetical protein [Isosphaeraceae bacterium]